MSNLLSQASLVMIPSGYKEDIVYSPVPTNGNGDLTFTRASNGTRINSAGLVEVCPWNLLTYSEEFNNASWTKTNCSITANTTTSPDGTQNADKIIENSVNGVHFTFNVGATLSVAQTLSVYAKADTRTQLALQLGASSVIYNLSNGTIVSGSGGAIENAGNGWYRCSITTTPTNTNALIFTANGGTNSYAGDGTSGLFIWGAQLNTGTLKPYFPTTDRLNVPRLTYQNGGGGCPSLLLEKQSTNLFPNSQTTANWSFSNMSRTANYGISPDGTQNADLLFPTTSGSVTFQSDTTTSSLVIGEPFVVSFFIKLNASFISNVGTNIFDIRLSGASVWSRPTIRVNLETGEVTNQNNASYISSTNFGNGWFRITFGATPTGTSGVVALQAPTGSTMNGGSFYIWGLQGEANATYATSYIPTTSSSATRVADACFKTGISSLIGQTEGVIFFDGYFGNETDEMYAIIQNSLGNSTTSSMYLIKSSSSIKFQSYDSSTTLQWEIQGGSYTIGQRIKIAGAYKANDIVLYVNGVQIGTDTSATITTCTALQIGVYPASPTANFQYNGKVNEVVLFTTRLTNAELASLTTI